MRRTILKWAVTAVSAVTLAVAAVVLPSAPAFASDMHRVQRQSVFGSFWWDRCESASLRQEVVYLESGSYNCGSGGGAYDYVLGFAALTTNLGGSHTLEVCDFDTEDYFDMVVDPANADGSSSGNLITYSDADGGGCLVAQKWFAIRKFRAGFLNAGSMWVAPY